MGQWDSLDADQAALLREQEKANAMAARDADASQAVLNPRIGAALHGATVGLSDEATAAGRSLFGGTPYADALRQERAGGQKFQEEHPGQDLALQMAGAVVPFALSRGATTIPTIARLGPRLAPLVRPLLSTAPAASRAALEGAAYGGAQAFGEGEGTGNRFASAVPGAVIGGITGGVAAPITDGIMTAARYPYEAAKRWWNPAGAADAATKKVVQNITRTGDIAGTGQRYMDHINLTGDIAQGGLPNTGLTLAEVLGPQVVNSLDAAAQMPGKGAADITKLMTDRQAGRVDRVKEGLSATFGDLNDAFSEKKRLAAQRSADATPLYEAAWASSQPPNVSDLALLKNVPEAAMTTAKRIAGMDGRTLSFQPQFNADGIMLPPAKGASLPNVEDLHHIKVGLQDFIEDHTRLDGSMDGQASRAIRMKDAIRDRLNEMTTGPDGVSLYEKATQAWGGPTSEMRALKIGGRASNMSAVEIRDALSEMSDPEKQAFAAGFMDDLRNRMSKVDLNGTANPVRAVFRDQKQRDAAELALGALGLPPEQVGARFKRLDDFFAQEMMAAKTENKVLSGSQTAMRNAWMRDLATPAVAGTTVGVGSYIQGNDPVTSALKGAGVMLGGKVLGSAGRAWTARGTENMNNQMMTMLGSQTPGEQFNALSALYRRAATDSAGTGSGVVPRAVGAVTGQQFGPRVGGMLGLTGPPQQLPDPWDPNTVRTGQ